MLSVPCPQVTVYTSGIKRPVLTFFTKKNVVIPSSPNDAWKASVFPFFEDVTREKKHTRPTQLNIQPLEQAAEKSGFFQSQEAALQANLLLMSV